MPLNSEPGWESEARTPRGRHPTIQITVQGYLTFKELVGKRRVPMPAGSDLQDLLDRLREELGERFKQEAFDARGELGEHVAVLLNGRHYRHLPEGISTVLEDGDQVAIFPPIVGG